MHAQVELVPNGGSKAVTAENVMEYVHRVANYRLNFQIKAASEAFWRGFYDLVTQDWVTMFNEEEVQMLISGGGEGLNVADMQAHVNYAGGYHEEHPVIVDFWKVQSLSKRIGMCLLLMSFDVHAILQVIGLIGSASACGKSSLLTVET